MEHATRPRPQGPEAGCTPRPAHAPLVASRCGCAGATLIASRTLAGSKPRAASVARVLPLAALSGPRAASRGALSLRAETRPQRAALFSSIFRQVGAVPGLSSVFGLTQPGEMSGSPPRISMRSPGSPRRKCVRAGRAGSGHAGTTAVLRRALSPGTAPPRPAPLRPALPPWTPFRTLR